MKVTRIYSPYAHEAACLLGAQIRAARVERRWTARELADRAGISVATLSKVERGDMTVALGTALEVAALVGVPLFHEGPARLTLELERAQDRVALLPQRVRPSRERLRDDF